MALPFDPFTEAAQLQRSECRNGLTYDELGKSAAKVYARCSGSLPPSGEVDYEPWACVAGKAASIIDLPDSEQGETSLSAKALAKALYNQYNIECDRNPDWESVEEPKRRAWEAVGRHLANCIDADGQAVNFEDWEHQAISWHSVGNV